MVRWAKEFCYHLRGYLANENGFEVYYGYERWGLIVLLLAVCAVFFRHQLQQVGSAIVQALLGIMGMWRG